MGPLSVSWMMTKPLFSLLREDERKYVAHSPVLSLMGEPPLLHQGLALKSGKTHGRRAIPSMQPVFTLWPTAPRVCVLNSMVWNMTLLVHTHSHFLLKTQVTVPDLMQTQEEEEGRRRAIVVRAGHKGQEKDGC